MDKNAFVSIISDKPGVSRILPANTHSYRAIH